MPDWWRPLLFARICLIALAVFMLIGGVCSYAFGSAGKYRFFKGMWAGALIFISIVIVIVIVAAVLVYTGVVTPEGFAF